MKTASLQNMGLTAEGLLGRLTDLFHTAPTSSASGTDRDGNAADMTVVLRSMAPFYFPVHSLKLRAALALLAASLVLVPLVFKNTNIPLPATARASALRGTVYLAPGIPNTGAPSVTAASIQEVHIADSGLTLLRGARVVSVGDGGLRVSLALGGGSLAWDIRVVYATRFLDKTGETVSLTDIREGDLVTITGQMRQGGANPSVEAQYVRDQSL